MQAGHMFGKGNLCLKAQSLKINCCSKASQASLNTTHTHNTGTSLHCHSEGPFMRTKAFASTFSMRSTIKSVGETGETRNLPHLELHLRVAASGRQHSEEDLHCKKKQQLNVECKILETPTSTFLMSMPRACDSKNKFVNVCTKYFKRVLWYLNSTVSQTNHILVHLT